MRTQNEIIIYGDTERVRKRVFELAADLQHWPTVLPHYWRMNVTEQSERHKIADFGASRTFLVLRKSKSGIREEWKETKEGSILIKREYTDIESKIAFPCRWRARQELFPEEGRITFKHIGGITKGMWVEWRIEPRSNHVHVTIDHELTYPIPILGPWFANTIVGKVFIHNIAGKTLQCFKEKIEAEGTAS